MSDKIEFKFMQDNFGTLEGELKIGLQHMKEIIVSNASRSIQRDALLELMKNALADLIYEATHLSPQEEDGSHRCRIHAKPLMRARSALRAYDNLIKNAPETRLDSKEHGGKDA